MKPLGAVFARGKEIESILAALGMVLLDLESLLGRLGAVFGQSWAVLSRSWAVLSRSWAVLGRSWAVLGRSWSGLGAILGPSRSPLGLKNIYFPLVFQLFLNNHDF